MSEQFDLNALKANSQAEAKKSPELSVEQQLRALEEEVIRFKAEKGKPNALEVFDSLSTEEQAAQLAEANTRLPANEQDTIESYRDSITPKGINKWDLRISVAEAKMRKLREQEK